MSSSTSVAAPSPNPGAPSWLHDLRTANLKKTKPQSHTSKLAIPDPPGFSPSSPISKKHQQSHAATQSQTQPNSTQKSTSKSELYLKKSWELALSPSKSLPMNLLMMYMSGNSLQIFSIMMTFMLFMNPIKALSSVNSTFRRFETPETKSQLWLVKLTYIALQLLSLMIGVWKVNAMGLLPTARSDWLAWETERVSREYGATVFTT